MMNEKITLGDNKGSQVYACNDTWNFKVEEKTEHHINQKNKKKEKLNYQWLLYTGFCSLKPPQQWQVKRFKKISAQNTWNSETTWNIIHVINFKPSYTTILISFI